MLLLARDTAAKHRALQWEGLQISLCLRLNSDDPSTGEAGFPWTFRKCKATDVPPPDTDISSPHFCTQETKVITNRTRAKYIFAHYLTKNQDYSKPTDLPFSQNWETSCASASAASEWEVG